MDADKIAMVGLKNIAQNARYFIEELCLYDGLYFVRLIVPRGQHMVKNSYGLNMGKLKLLSPYERPRFTLHPAVFHGLAAS